MYTQQHDEWRLIKQLRNRLMYKTDRIASILLITGNTYSLLACKY